MAIVLPIDVVRRAGATFAPRAFARTRRHWHPHLPSMPPSHLPVKRQRRPDTVPQAGSMVTVPRGREGVEGLRVPVLKGSPLAPLACGQERPLADLNLIEPPSRSVELRPAARDRDGC